MINLVLALPSEARPLLSYFGLQRPNSSTDFPLYEKDGLRLIVSGIGKTAAAAATAYLRALRPPCPALWLNIGVAGHGEHCVGTPLLAHKIIDASSRRTFYPAFPFPPPCQTTTVMTVEQVVETYPDTWAYDMEASGFCTTARRFAPHALIHCLKIVSDNPQFSPHRLSAQKVEALIGKHLELIDALVQLLAPLVQELTARGREPPFFADFLQHWHFTVAQQHQLRRLLQQHCTLAPQQPLAHQDFRDLKKAAEVLAQLRRLNDSIPFVLGEKGMIS